MDNTDKIGQLSLALLKQDKIIKSYDEKVERIEKILNDYNFEEPVAVRVKEINEHKDRGLTTYDLEWGIAYEDGFDDFSKIQVSWESRAYTGTVDCSDSHMFSQLSAKEKKEYGPFLDKLLDEIITTLNK